MEITTEDKAELNRLAEISKNQIPTYLNLINSEKIEWDVKNIEDCVFGMVFHKYLELSGQYLSNKMVDDAEAVNTKNTMETFDASLEVWGDHVAEIKHAIFETSKPN
ncbi:MAG: hypothetical protein ACE5RN_07240 [Nitrosopumilaceae archaeon]